MDRIFSDLHQNIEPEPLKLNIELLDKSFIEIDVTNMQTLMEIKQYHLESTFMGLFSNFHFEKDGVKLNEGVELMFLGLVNDETIKVTLDNYDEKTAKYHVKKIFELLENPERISKIFHKNKQMKAHNKQKSANHTKESIDKSLALLISEPSLNTLKVISPEFKPHNALKLVNIFEMASFNPPTAARTMAGDFFYLHVRVLHGMHYYLTSNSQGFFVNESTSSKLDPKHNEEYPIFSNLLDFLLTVDNSFSSKFKEIQEIGLTGKDTDKPAFIFLSDTNKWLSNEQTSHSMSLERDSLYGLDPSGMRDWNDELQGCKELPRTNYLMEINREIALNTTKNDFLEAAIEGAKAIIEQKIWPLNPMDEKVQHIYVYNHIFYSFAVETPEDFTQELGKDASPSVSTSNCDLKNLKLLYKAEIPELSLINEALIDFKGTRIIAQSIIPGILSSDYKSFTLYGSLDEGKTIQYDEKFHNLIKKICSHFYIEDNIPFVDDEGKKFEIAGSIEIKGIKGNDNRNYAIDLMRLSPRDLNYSDPELHSTCVLRHELLNHYANSLLIDQIINREDIQQLQKDKDYENYFKTINEEFAKASKAGVSLKLNPNIGIASSFKEENPSQREELEKIAKFLKAKMIPQLIRELLEGDSYHLADSFTIAESFHNFGINMRYLGEVYKTIPKEYPNIKLSLEKCVILKAMKYIFREALRESDSLIVSEVIAHLLNITFYGNSVNPSEKTSSVISNNNNANGTGSLGKKKKKKRGGNKEKVAPNEIQEEKKEETSKSIQKKKPISVQSLFSTIIKLQKPKSNFLAWKSDQLWKRVQELAEKRYSHILPPISECKTMNLPFMKISLLKNLCLSTGMVIRMADYEIFCSGKSKSNKRFEPQDLVELRPVAKHLCSVSEDINSRMELAQALTSQKEFSKAEEQYKSTIELLKNIYGPCTKEMAVCNILLASICSSSSKNENALGHLKAAKKIYENLYGSDHYLTISAYNRIAIHYFQSKSTIHKALKYFVRCEYLSLVIGGEAFPSDNFTFALSRILLEIGKGTEAIDLIYYLLGNNKVVFGESHSIISECYNSLANILMEMGDSTRSFEMLENSINILLVSTL